MTLLLPTPPPLPAIGPWNTREARAGFTEETALSSKSGSIPRCSWLNGLTVLAHLRRPFASLVKGPLYTNSSSDPIVSVTFRDLPPLADSPRAREVCAVVQFEALFAEAAYNFFIIMDLSIFKKPAQVFRYLKSCFRLSSFSGKCRRWWFRPKRRYKNNLNR